MEQGALTSRMNHVSVVSGHFSRFVHDVHMHVYLQSLNSNMKRWGLSSLDFELILLL